MHDAHDNHISSKIHNSIMYNYRVSPTHFFYVYTYKNLKSIELKQIETAALQDHTLNKSLWY